MCSSRTASLRRAWVLLAVLAGAPAGVLGATTPADLSAVRFVFVKTPRLEFRFPWELRLAERDTNLYTVRGDGSGLRPITNYSHASVRRPAVRFDGARIVFSMCPRGSRDRWHIYECNADGSNLRRLTLGPYDDVDPFYLPDGRIAFLSNRTEILDEYHRELATLLHTMRPDGSDVRQISFNLSHDLRPRLFSDGRIYYTRWEHRNFRTHRFPIFTVRPDGTELFSCFGHRHFAQAPISDFCELSGGRLLGVARVGSYAKPGSNPGRFGRLVVADPALGMASGPRPLVPGKDDGWRYRTPSTLPDGRIVAVRARGDLRSPLEGGIVVLSADGAREQPIYDDPAMIELFPEAIVPREPPPVLPSSVDPMKTTGIIAGINVFRSELRHDNGSLYQPMGHLEGRVRAIRVLRGFGCRAENPSPRSKNGGSFIMPLNAEVVLGEAPVYPDGSFAVEVPAGVPLVFQALDEQGMDLTFHKSWVNVMPGEKRLCMGCHEHRDHAPMNQMPLALQRPPERVAERGEPVAYLESVAPIVKAKCESCHEPGGPRGLHGTAYRGNEHTNRTKGPILRYVRPHYARDSFLIWKLYGRALSDGRGLDQAHSRPPRDTWRGSPMPPTHAPQLTPDELRTVVLWVELGAYYRAFPFRDDDEAPTAPEPPTVEPAGAIALTPDVPAGDPGDFFPDPAPRPRRSAPEGPTPPRIFASPRKPDRPLPVDPVQAYEYKSPMRLAVSPDGSRLYVSNSTAGSVSVVDTATGRVLREIPVGPEPVGLAVSHDGGTVYVAVRGSHSVAALDPKAGRVVQRCQVAYEPYGLALSPDGKLLLATSVVSGSVSLVSVPKLRPLTQIPVSREPRGVAFAPGGKIALVANALSPEPATRPDVAAVVSVVDIGTGKAMAEVGTVDGNALRDIVVSPDGKWAYVAHQIPRFNVPTTQVTQGWIQTNGLTILDLRGAPHHHATVPLDTFTGGAANPCGLAIAPDGKTLYVSHTGTHQITVVDLPRLHGVTAGRRHEARRRRDASLADPRDLARDLGALPRAHVFTRWDSGGFGPMGITLSPDGKTLYVAHYFSDTVTALDTASGRVDRTIRVGPEKPMTRVRRGHFLFHDARRSCFQGWLSCASCHPEGGADGLNWDLLNDGMGNRKNAKMLVGALATPPAMSTGVRPDGETAVAKGFQFIQFRQHTDQEQEAVVAYLRWARHRPSPFHRKPDGSLDASATRGKALFDDGRVGCSSCHPAPSYTDQRLYDVGTRSPEDRRDTYDTPSLRELYRTAPYLHSGAAATLRGMLTTFNPHDRHGRTSHLSTQQLDDLVAFLRSL